MNTLSIPLFPYRELFSSQSTESDSQIMSCFSLYTAIYNLQLLEAVTRYAAQSWKNIHFDIKIKNIEALQNL